MIKSQGWIYNEIEKFFRDEHKEEDCVKFIQTEWGLVEEQKKEFNKFIKNFNKFVENNHYNDSLLEHFGHVRLMIDELKEELLGGE